MVSGCVGTRGIGKERTYHDHGDGLADLAGLLKLALLLLKLDLCLLVAALDLLEIKTDSLGQLVVITLADLQHALPVIMVYTKDQGEDGDEDAG